VDLEADANVNNEKEADANDSNAKENRVEDNKLLEEQCKDVEANKEPKNKLHDDRDKRDAHQERVEDCSMLEIVTAIINEIITVITTGSEHVLEDKNTDPTLEKEAMVDVQFGHLPSSTSPVEGHIESQSSAGKDQLLVEETEKLTVDKLKELLLQAKLQEKEGKKKWRRLMIANKNE
jgi:hypothetical protein